ncbi:pyridoxal phosphate-dependent aminotransferase [Acidilobus sp.]|uniref:pyridoxal phosphate-dependent aminotransferase n=1 Tax=Acidilobus sp. TaxID=1872109 RepID=UPI003D0163D6
MRRPAAGVNRAHGGTAPPGALDFSAPANPLGPPPGLREAVSECAALGSYLRYPSPSDYLNLLGAVSEFLDVDEDHVVLSNGSAELLSLIPLSLRARSLIVVEPNFGDHELLAKATSLELVRVVMRPSDSAFYLDEDSIIRAARAARGPAVLVLSRPNNPTGLAADEKAIDRIASSLPRRAWMVVDEAFMDLCPSCRSLGDRDDIIVLRSFTKSLASPGLRLGAMVTANRRALEAVAGSLQAWPIDSITACSLSKVLALKSTTLHVERGKELVRQELPRVTSALRSMGLRAFDSSAPYVLVRHALPNPQFQRSLLAHGFYVRDASTFYSLDSHYSRISIRSPSENDAILKAIEVVMGWA